MYKSSIAHFQGVRRKGRVQFGPHICTTSLEKSVRPQKGMPGYIEGAYKVDDEATLKTLSESLIYLQEGDVLIRKERTALYSSGLGAGGRVMLIQLSRGS